MYGHKRHVNIVLFNGLGLVWNQEVAIKAYLETG